MFAANGKSRLRFNSVLVSILASEQNGVFNNTLKSAGDIYNKFSNAVAAVAKDYSLIRYIDGSIGSVVEKDVLNYIRLVDSYPKMKKLIDNNQ